MLPCRLMSKRARSVEQKRLSEPLEGGEIRYRLTIEFENEVAGLETGHFGQAAFLDISHDESGIGG